VPRRTDGERRRKGTPAGGPTPCGGGPTRCPCVPPRPELEDGPLDPERAASLQEIVKLLEAGFGRPATREDLEARTRMPQLPSPPPWGCMLGSGG
jgi:hypothetical protein